MHDINASGGDSIYTSSYLSPPPTRGNWWHTGRRKGKRSKREENCRVKMLWQTNPVSTRLLRGSTRNTRHPLDFIVTIPARFTITIGSLDRAIKVRVIGRKLPLRYYARVHYFRLALVHLDERQIVFVRWAIFVLSMQIRGGKSW